jgi:hypothetical protein
VKVVVGKVSDFENGDRKIMDMNGRPGAMSCPARSRAAR